MKRAQRTPPPTRDDLDRCVKMMTPNQDAALHQSRDIKVFAAEHVGGGGSAALLASGASVEPFRTERVEEALSDGQATCAILWHYPAEVIAMAMEAGRDITEAAEDWLADALNVLALFRRNRRNLLLIDSRVLTSSASDAERDALRDKLQLESLSALAYNPAEPDNRTAFLLASLIIPQMRSLRKCLDELEASSFSPAPRNFSAAELSSVADAFKQISEQISRTEDLEEEISLLRSQVSLQQEEIERVLKEHQLENLASEKALARALADLRAEAQSRVKLQEERDSLAHRASELSGRLEELFLSTSWKATRPLRAAKRLITGSAVPEDEALATNKEKHPKR